MSCLKLSGILSFWLRQALKGCIHIKNIIFILVVSYALTQSFLLVPLFYYRLLFFLRSVSLNLFFSFYSDYQWCLEFCRLKLVLSGNLNSDREHLTWVNPLYCVFIIKKVRYSSVYGWLCLFSGLNCKHSDSRAAFGNITLGNLKLPARNLKSILKTIR